MMMRPTIRDLAEKAGVSVATVNRVLAGQDGVRPAMREKVERAAGEIGFYGLGAIQNRNLASRPKYRFGVLLLQPHRPFYQMTAAALRDAARAVTDADVELRIEFLEDLSPQNTASRALELSRDCQAICVTAAVHPVVTEALDRITDDGVPVFAFITQLSATGQFPYVGLDNWKVGRQAAWAIANVCKAPGKIGILLGNPRYRNQEMNETGFRSYFREYATEFTLLEPLSTFESSAVSQEMTEKLLREHSDLAGLYVAGGGISGALSALRAQGRSGTLVVVGYELMDVTRAALLDGTMTVAIAHPLRQMADCAIGGMIEAASNPQDVGSLTKITPFEIYTRENI
ncbi:LacI family DNA-binding transcriptional regulator [Rhizobium sp. G187]|uniref:LacI family DNA-binding transcriptional regulator n=1 Tax=Rhizobium sp. G187 TaxID=3451352 RepID=UPI003EE43B50